MFPCVPGGKNPATQRGHLEATTDPTQIDAWWRENPSYNVGIAVAPSGLVALDVDVGVKKDGTPKRGRESLAEIEHELTATLLAETGRGGIHAVYARPPDVEAKRIIGFKDGLDLIGEGYIVAAPSFNAETGRYYRWAQLQPIAPLPPVLQSVARAPRNTEIVQAVGTPIVEGGRNNALFKLGCALRDTGIGAEALARALDAENRSRFDPPLPDPEVGTIVNSVLRTVQVTRDVALGAIVEQEIQQIFAPPASEEWLENVALLPQPPVLFYSTGFKELDRLLGDGFATGQLTGVIGPPSAGKSALIGHWLLELAKHRPVLHCSLELQKRELFVRYAAHRMSFPWRDGIKGHVKHADMAGAVKGLRIKVMGADEFDRVDPFGSLEAAVARMTQECGIAPVVAIDYVQLMARGAQTEMRHKIGELSFRARQLAQKFDTVVLGVFTTQRSTYNSAAVEKMRTAQDPTAYLGAAKEAGEIEYDCATLLYLDVDKLHEGATKPAQVAVARCRQGDVGFVGLRAKLDIGSFEEDQSAVAEFASEARVAKRQAVSEQSATDAVLEAVRAMPNRPWREIQARAAATPGVNRTMVDRARDKLLGDRGIEERERFDEHHRKVKGKTYIVRNADSPTSVLAEDDGHEGSE